MKKKLNAIIALLLCGACLPAMPLSANAEATIKRYSTVENIADNDGDETTCNYYEVYSETFDYVHKDYPLKYNFTQHPYHKYECSLTAHNGSKANFMVTGIFRDENGEPLVYTLKEIKDMTGEEMRSGTVPAKGGGDYTWPASSLEQSGTTVPLKGKKISVGDLFYIDYREGIGIGDDEEDDFGILDGHGWWDGGAEPSFNTRSLDEMCENAAEYPETYFKQWSQWAPEGTVTEGRETDPEFYRECMLNHLRDAEICEYLGNGVDVFGEDFVNVIRCELSITPYVNMNTVDFYNIDVEDYSRSDVRYGDVTNDDTVGVVDVLATNQYLLGIHQLNDYSKLAADVNHDGSINDADTLSVLKSVVGLETLQ
ncbi:MAG: dockerin type I repeat-containing protein [Oscillospiraceae bacterium]